MLPMSVTFEVSKPERSREAREGQPKNMKLMSVTCEVSKLDRLSV